MPRKSKLYPWLFYSPIYVPILILSLTYGLESGAFVPFYRGHQALCITWLVLGCVAMAAGGYLMNGSRTDPSANMSLHCTASGVTCG